MINIRMNAKEFFTYANNWNDSNSIFTSRYGKMIIETTFTIDNKEYKTGVYYNKIYIKR